MCRSPGYQCVNAAAENYRLRGQLSENLRYHSRPFARRLFVIHDIMSHDRVIRILLSMAYDINTGWVKDIALDELALKSLVKEGA